MLGRRKKLIIYIFLYFLFVTDNNNNKGLEDFAEIDRDLLVENAREFFDLNSQENLINEVIELS